MLSLYVHIPFCVSKCAYCDFASWPHREALWDAYIDTLLEELDSRRDMLARGVDTVFVGGGTPTVLTEGMLYRLLSALPHTEGAEFTVESNPGTLTGEKLRAMKACGVNRLSMGAQSFDDGLLKMLGRIHTAEEIAASMALARREGFDNINLDLMYALPSQTEAQWEDTLRRAIALRPEHLSAYSLIVEPGTPMAARVESGLAVLPDEDTAVAMQRAANRTLAAAGYARYEISNYALPGRECRHNTGYWRRKDYLGIGCAAHSLADGARFSNPASLDEYMRGARAQDKQILSEDDVYEETVMLGTRMTEGIELSVLRDRSPLPKLQSLGLIETEGGRLRLTEKGLELQDAVIMELL